MAKSVSKTWKDAGYAPGQRQELKISYKSRNKGTLVFTYKLYVKSNGYDNYDYSTRHNIARFFYNSKQEKSFTYQLKGTKTSKTFTGEFKVTGVGNSTTSANIYYQNDRWFDGRYQSDPRSTGVVSKTKIGTISFPANTKYNITYDRVISSTVSNMPSNGTCWKGDNYTVSSNTPTNHYYTFVGWSTTKYNPGEGSVDRLQGKSYSISSNITLYAVWKPKTCKYFYYGYNRDIISDLKDEVSYTNHTYGTSTILPNLNIYKESKYKQPGYEFTGWQTLGSGTSYLISDGTINKCTEWPKEDSSELAVYFEPYSTSESNGIRFYYGTEDNLIRTYTDYVTDTKFNFNRPLVDISKNSITVRPGYKLIGWSTKLMNIAMPLAGLSPGDYVDTTTGSPYTIYPIEGEKVIDYKYFTGNALNLHAYYEYYTTVWIYQDSKWRLALPYIYTDNKWSMSLSSVYTPDKEWRL